MESKLKRLSLYCLTLCSLILMTVNADLRLVTSNDYLTILKYGQTEPISTFEVAGFKNYNFFGVNHTINGTACYMDDIELVVETIQTQ